MESHAEFLGRSQKRLPARFTRLFRCHFRWRRLNVRMKSRFLTILLLSGFARLAWADSTNLPAKIGTLEAPSHYDQLMTVTGTVAQVTLRPSIVFINLDLPYPQSPFAAVIRSKDTNQFGDLPSLKGRSVEITGKVQKYHDKPEIVLEKVSQIFVLGGWAAPTNAPAALKGTNDLTKGVM